MGFLKRKPEERRTQLKTIQDQKKITVVLDTPYRLQALIEDCQKTFKNQNTKFLIAIEIGNDSQKYLFGSIDQVKEKTTAIKKQNFVLIIYPQ